MGKTKILVSGYFGYKSNQLDGQTIKTRDIYNLLNSKKKEENFELSYFDTQSFQKSKMNVCRMFFQIIMCDKLVYIAAQDNLKYFFPVIFILSKLFRLEIHFIVVGGWLADFIKKKNIHTRFLRKIGRIYPETKDLTERLQREYNFKNVYQLQNFRITENQNFHKPERKTDPNNIKLVFMARVHPMKGVETLFRLAEKLNLFNINHVSIDMYGPIYDEDVYDGYSKDFLEQIDECANLFYKGNLAQDEIHNTIAQYDLFLFPTKFFTEGFPGSILDAYISGVPVIATRWQYADEFVNDGVCGVITSFEDNDDFINKTIQLVLNPSEIEFLKKGVPAQLIKYSPDIAWEILKDSLF